MHDFDSTVDRTAPDGVPPSEGGTPLGWRSPALAPITLRLLTPRLIVEGLQCLGLEWDPRPFEKVAEDDHRPGMYTWVDGIDLSRGPFDRAVLYTGIGQERQGVRSRVAKESSWKTGDHAHGRMLDRRDAHALVGQVIARDAPDLSFLQELSERGLLKDRGAISSETGSGTTGRSSAPRSSLSG